MLLTNCEVHFFIMLPIILQPSVQDCWQVHYMRVFPCAWMYVYVCVCVCVSSLYPLFYPQLREADRIRRSSSMDLGGPVVWDAAPPVPEEPRLETVALSE